MITEQQIINIQNQWGAGVVKIGTLRNNGTECKNFRGINLSYDKLLFLKKQTIGFWGNGHNNILFISYFINEKISQLKSGLGQHLKNPPKIKGKIFSNSAKCFRAIYPELVCIYNFN